MDGFSIEIGLTYLVVALIIAVAVYLAITPVKKRDEKNK
jgi:hypothetical protein